MASQDPTTDDTTADPSSTHETHNNGWRLPAFLRGEWTWLWPVWVLAGLMLLVILWDHFVQF